MKTFLAFLILLSTLNTNAQVDWSKTSHWKIYKVPGPNIFSISIDSLTGLNSQTLRQDSILMYIGNSTILPDSVKPIWMGGWAASYKLGSQLHKIQVSTYGAFFYDQSTGRFYQIPISLKKEWMTYINLKLSLL